MGGGKWKRDTKRNFTLAGGVIDPSFMSFGMVDKKTNKALFSTIKEQPKFAVDLVSKTFHGAQILLKEPPRGTHNLEDVVNFFTLLDTVDIVYFSTDYITDDTLFILLCDGKKYTLPVHIFWSCLPQYLKNSCKSAGGFYTIYKKLFVSHNKNFLFDSSFDAL